MNCSQRLDVVRLEPAVVLDLGAGTGHASLALKRRFRASQVVALDLAEGMLREAGRRQTLLRRFRRVCADAAALPLRDASVDLVFSNLMLHWCTDPDAVFARVPAGTAAGRPAHVHDLRSGHAGRAAPGLGRGRPPYPRQPLHRHARPR